MKTELRVIGIVQNSTFENMFILKLKQIHPNKPSYFCTADSCLTIGITDIEEAFKFNLGDKVIMELRKEDD